MTRRWPWQLLVATILVVLLATLATFQYRWLGEVSQAERERMRAGLRTRAFEFAQEFDSELTRTYVAFHDDSERIDSDPAAALADGHVRWRSSTMAPALVRGIYLLEGRTFDAGTLRRFDPDRRTLEPVEWPPELAASLHRTQHAVPRIAGAAPAMLMADAIDSRIPALIIPVPRVTRMADDGMVNVFTDSAAVPRVVIVVLDAARLQQDVVEPLMAKHFGDRVTSDYAVTIVRRDEAGTVVYNSSERPVDAATADVTQGVFDLRMDELNRIAKGRIPGVSGPARAEPRAPVAVICSAGENLADGVVADGPQVKRYGSLIQSEGRRLHDMVERVLEFAGVTSGAPPRPHTAVDVTRVIADAIGGLRAEASDRGVTINVHMNGSLPAVRGDADPLRSAGQDISGYAVKVSSAGTTVDVGTDVSGSSVQIRVADRGLGIDADDLPHIFKPFRRGRRAMEVQIQGTGIGLSVVRHVVDAHHGEVRIDSRPGEGTTVIVELPVSEVSDTGV